MLTGSFSLTEDLLFHNATRVPITQEFFSCYFLQIKLLITSLCETTSAWAEVSSEDPFQLLSKTQQLSQGSAAKMM